MPRPSQHREALLRAALRLFRRQGYSRTGLSEVLALSGAPRGSLYHHFPGGKEELAAEAVRAGCAVVSTTLERLLETTSTVDEFVDAYTGLLGEWLAASGYRDGCPVATTLLETVPDSEAISRAGEAGMADWLAILSTLYRRDGLEQPAAERCATALVAAVEGALLLARVQRSTAPLAAVRAVFAARCAGDQS